MRRHLVRGLVALFVLLDLVVVAGATRAMLRPSGSASAAATPALPPGGPRPNEVVGPSLLAVAPDGTVLRATRGSCADGRLPQVAAARAGAAPAELAVAGLAEVLAVEAGADAWRLAGLDETCAPYAVVSTDDGRSWKPGAEPGWALTADPALVRSPAGLRRVPPDCQPQTLVPDGDSAWVACLSGEVVQLFPTRSYVVDTEIAGLRALARVGGRMVVASREDTCPARLSSYRERDQVDRGPCLAADRAITGMVADRGRLYVQLGNELVVTDDLGVTVEGVG